MIVYLIAMVVILVVTAGIAGMVLIGMEGRQLGRYPRLARFLTRAAQHLNGEAEELEGRDSVPRLHQHV